MGAAASREPAPAPSLRREQLAALRRKFGPAHTAPISALVRLPELCANPLALLILELLDVDDDGSISFAEFVKAAEWFSPRRSTQELYRLAFAVCDLNLDGAIDSLELFSMLKALLGYEGSAYSDAQLEHIVKCTLEQYGGADFRLGPDAFMQLLQPSDLRAKFTLPLL